MNTTVNGTLKEIISYEYITNYKDVNIKACQQILLKTVG